MLVATIQSQECESMPTNSAQLQLTCEVGAVFQRLQKNMHVFSKLSLSLSPPLSLSLSPSPTLPLSRLALA